jgi:hypothetical protein
MSPNHDEKVNENDDDREQQWIAMDVSPHDELYTLDPSIDAANNLGIETRGDSALATSFTSSSTISSSSQLDPGLLKNPKGERERAAEVVDNGEDSQTNDAKSTEPETKIKMEEMGQQS